ncbi:MAG: hexosyltransferase, partial [Planctomyces sp.]
MKVTIITAGGAGMFCGSCMQDNTLVRSLRLAGADAVLLPTYTPIRVDEENQSSDRVFLGGLNVYLDSAIPGWSRLPSFLKRWLDHPAVIRQLSRFSGSTDASKLGPLTIDMLKGIHGPQRNSITELIDYLATPGQADIIVFSNALISGIIPELRRRFHGTLITILQGDDVFLDDLPLNYRTEAIRLIRENLATCDGLLAHSDYYADAMSDYLGVQRSLIQKIPLTIDQAPEFPPAADEDQKPVTLGYFARLCPEKGVDRFLQAASRVISS